MDTSLAIKTGSRCIRIYRSVNTRFLIRFLNLNSYDEALSIISRYYPLDGFPQKTLYALEEILDH